ncbi:MAG: type II secretion system protein, partial [Deltaproteobacteria bacterium]|nr:type II secretion system protein [Deltaproteobacteria bacterium]
KGNKKAFTLIELIVVIFIISMAAALVAPRLGGSSKSLKLKRAATHLTALFRYARMRSIVLGYPLIIKMIVEKNLFIFEDLSVKEDKNIEGEEEKETIKILQKKYILPKGVSISNLMLNKKEISDKGEMIFYPDGTIDEVELTLKGDKKRS